MYVVQHLWLIGSQGIEPLVLVGDALSRIGEATQYSSDLMHSLLHAVLIRTLEVLAMAGWDLFGWWVL